MLRSEFVVQLVTFIMVPRGLCVAYNAVNWVNSIRRCVLGRFSRLMREWHTLYLRAADQRQSLGTSAERFHLTLVIDERVAYPYDIFVTALYAREMACYELPLYCRQVKSGTVGQISRSCPRTV